MSAQISIDEISTLMSDHEQFYREIYTQRVNGMINFAKQYLATIVAKKARPESTVWVVKRCLVPTVNNFPGPIFSGMHPSSDEGVITLRNKPITQYQFSFVKPDTCAIHLCWYEIHEDLAKKLQPLGWNLSVKFELSVLMK